MKKILFLLIGLLMLTSCSQRYELDGSTWTAYKFTQNGKTMMADEYVESVDKDTVDVIGNIRFKGNKAILTNITYANKNIKIKRNGGIVHLQKGDSWNQNSSVRCVPMQSDYFAIDRALYRYKNDTLIEMNEVAVIPEKLIGVPNRGQLQVVPTGDDVMVTYIRDYGVKGRIFCLEKAYKDKKKIYDIDKDEKFKEDLPTQYSFSFKKGTNNKKEKFSLKCKELENQTEIKMVYKDKEETAIFDRLTETLTIDGNIKRIYRVIGKTRLEKK